MNLRRTAKLLRLAVTPRSWTVRTTLSNGAVVCAPNRSGFGARGIYLEGDSLEPELAVLDRLLPSEGTFVDVGANSGVYSLKAAKHFGGRGLVISIEPVVEVLAALGNSARANNLDNICLRNVCASDTTGSTVLWMNDETPNSFSITDRYAGARGLSVLTATLDDLLTWDHIDRLDYLKIDAEGAEQQVIDGAARMIAKHRPIIQVETTLRGIDPIPDGYEVFHAPGSPNCVMIPDGHFAVSVVGDLGWASVQKSVLANLGIRERTTPPRDATT